MRNYLRKREELRNLYNAPENRLLKYWAIVIIAIVIVLLLSIIIWADKISTNAYARLRGLGCLIVCRCRWNSFLSCE